jgi:hypothetical protein
MRVPNALESAEFCWDRSGFFCTSDFHCISFAIALIMTEIDDCLAADTDFRVVCVTVRA